MIVFPESSITVILGYITAIYTDVALLVLMAIGVPLGFYVARKIIKLVRVR